MSAAQKAAATGGKITVEFDGGTYQIDPAEKWDLDVLEAMEEGRVTTALKAVLGAKQYAQFRDTHSTVGDLQNLFEVIGDAAGMGNL